MAKYGKSTKEVVWMKIWLPEGENVDVGISSKPWGWKYKVSRGSKESRKVSGLKSSEKKEKILKFLSKTEDRKIIAGREKLIKNVPYRLLSPFTKEISEKIWNGDKKRLA